MRHDPALNTQSKRNKAALRAPFFFSRPKLHGIDFVLKKKNPDVVRVLFLSFVIPLGIN